ncbi:MAG: FG-GAP-like repeat-containing protein, partial [Planctomycetota bacterium]
SNAGGSAGTTNFVTTCGDDSCSVQAGAIAVNVNESKTGGQGRLQGSTIYFDSNYNGVYDFLDLNENDRRDAGEPGEPLASTELDGTFVIQIPEAFDIDGSGFIEPVEGRLYLSGGIDTSTGLDWNVPLTSPAGFLSVTPLTTLWQHMQSQTSWTPAEVQQQLSLAFALGDFDISGDEPIIAIMRNDPASAAAYRQQVIVSSIVIQVASLASGADGRSIGGHSEAVFANITDSLSATQAALDLSNPSFLRQLIRGVETDTGNDFASGTIDAAVELIHRGTRRINDLNLSDFAQPIEYLEAITKVKKLMHGDLASALHEIGDGSSMSASVLSQFSEANFDSLAAAQDIGIILPPRIGVGSALLIEGDDGTNVMQFEVVIAGEHDEVVSVDYLTRSETAIAGSDFTAINGTLTWAAGDTSTRIVEVPVIGDTEFETDEQLSLILQNPVNATVRLARGIGFILNDEPLQAASDASAGVSVTSITPSRSHVDLITNQSVIASGQHALPLQAEVVGEDQLSDRFIVDFSSATYRDGDRYYFDGAGQNDVVEIVGGRFSQATYQIGTPSTSSGAVQLTTESGEIIDVIWDNVEEVELTVSELEDLVLEVPETVTEMQFSDLDPHVPDIAAMSSPANEFAPVTFTIPTGAIERRLEASLGGTTIQSTDPVFTQRMTTIVVGTHDFGDAPEPYPTSSFVDGASHRATGPQLGPLRDTEIGNIPSTNADSDGDEEDGITFGEIQVSALDATVTVNVQGGDGKLDAWIDFNGDGNWGGPGEQIFDSVDVTTGDNLLTFDIPATTASGTTYARFRLSTAGGLGHGGAAEDGEVEDYQVVISFPNQSASVFTTETNVTASVNGFTSAESIDFDGDGDVDFLSTSVNGDPLVWHENLGDGSQFTEHAIVTSLQRSTPFHSVQIADVDSDGDLDVLAAMPDLGTIAWYENLGNQSFVENFIVTGMAGTTIVRVADIDSDGDWDVLSVPPGEDRIAWFAGDGSGTFTEQASISTVHDVERDLRTVDMDRDGDLDLVVAAHNSSGVWWHRNDGDGSFTELEVAAGVFKVKSVHPVDIDGDGDMDVLSASQDDWIRLHVNDGNEVFTSQLITFSDGTYGVSTADIDGDGDFDILSASTFDDRIAWHPNEGNNVFSEQVISTSTDGAQQVFAADVDGDGDLDIAARAANAHLSWFENVSPDYGDAPAPYPTTLADGGASHAPVGPTLGSLRDEEADGTPSVLDDGDGGDEDGVTFGTIQVGALDATVTVDVQGGNAKLDAWIDFDSDGNWGGRNEQIFASMDVSSGDNLLTFDVPPGAIAGETYARFRLSTEGGLGHGGTANDGEVEDYAVTIIGPNPGLGVFASQEVLNITHTATNGAWDVQTADIDGDGDLDLVTASASNNRVAWHENDGTEFFTAHTISDTAFSVRSVRVGDVDGDGHLDIVGANVGNDTIHWYQNDGNEVFTQRVFASGVDGFRGVELADLDGDGDLDVLSASINADTFMWHEYRKATDDVVNHVIDASADEAYNIRAVDIDGDGDLDVLGASASDDTIAWYENDGSQGFTKRVISNSVDGARDVIAADLDADGFMDVITASSFDHTIAWYKNDGSQNFTQQTLVSGGFNPSSVEAGDLDGDGDLDIAAVSVSNDRVAWLENLG